MRFLGGDAMKDSKLLYQIGEVSKLTGVSVHTIRYYEKIGLIHKPQRTQGDFRKYPKEEIEKIIFIKQAQTFGLTLEEINTIMDCSKQGLTPCCNKITEVLAEKIKEFESKIKELQKMKRRLKKLVSGWTKK
jgi:MerR family copper efflux transcriptional regulator